MFGKEYLIVKLSITPIPRRMMSVHAHNVSRDTWRGAAHQKTVAKATVQFLCEGGQAVSGFQLGGDGCHMLALEACA